MADGVFGGDTFCGSGGLHRKSQSGLHRVFLELVVAVRLGLTISRRCSRLLYAGEADMPSRDY